MKIENLLLFDMSQRKKINHDINEKLVQIISDQTQDHLQKIDIHIIINHLKIIKKKKGKKIIEKINKKVV